MGHSGWDCKECGHRNKRRAERCICGRSRHDHTSASRHSTKNTGKDSKAKQPVVKSVKGSKP